MARSKPPSPDVKRHLRFVVKLDRWFAKAGIESAKTRADLAVDLADSIYAAGEIRILVGKMLACDPTTRRGADRALNHAGYIDALAFTELKYHVSSLQRVWVPKLMERLAATAEGKSSVGG